VPKAIKTKTTFSGNDAGPRFLLFRKSRERSRWSEPPAKTSEGFEAAVLIAYCLALVAIAVLVLHVFQRR
jgi:hypothetical protein